jgi:hypothetical protein
MAWVGVARSSAAPAALAGAGRLAGIAAILAASLVAPALILVWMPIVLGVPHVASDIRYLLLPLPRREVVLGAVACGALVAVRVAAIATGASVLRVELAIVGAWLIAALAAVPARRGARLAAAGIAAAVVALPVAAAAIAALAHSLVAIVAWIVVARPARRERALVVGAVLAAAAIAGVLGPAIAAHTGGDATPWLTLDRAARTLFPGLPGGLAAALAVAFAFLQAIHYAIWLAWVPADRPAPRRGALPALAVGAATLGVVAAAAVDAAWARTTYLALATFHIYLELVVLGVWLARRPAAR